MKKFLLAVLFLSSFSHCRKSNPEPLPEIAPIVGKWRVVAHSRMVGDSLVTNSVAKENATVYEFRFDGVLLNEKGYMPCCLSQKYLFDGKIFEAKPRTRVQQDPSCIYVDCAPCPQTNIKRPTADSLLVEFCQGTYTSLVREE